MAVANVNRRSQQNHAKLYIHLHFLIRDLYEVISIRLALVISSHVRNLVFSEERHRLAGEDVCQVREQFLVLIIQILNNW